MEAPTTGRIRSAIASGEYDEALQLWNEYAAHLGNDLVRGGLSAAALAETGEMLIWARENILCARAHMLDRINNAYVAHVYAGAPRVPPSEL